MGFSRQEYWSGLPFPPPGDLPDPGIEPGSPALQVDPLPIELHKHLFLPQLTSLQILTHHGSMLWFLTYFWGLYTCMFWMCYLLLTVYMCFECATFCSLVLKVSVASASSQPGSETDEGYQKDKRGWGNLSFLSEAPGFWAAMWAMAQNLSLQQGDRRVSPACPRR